MGDRAALISLFIKEGVSDPKVMRRLYDEGGDTSDIKPAVADASYPREREVLDLVNNSKADFVSRLADGNRATIPDWNNKDEIATHKLSYARDGDRWIIYPNVQNIDGKLYDFSDPKYGLDKGWQALDSALYAGDYVEVPSEADARWFTESYKRHYPGFNKYDGKTEKSQKMQKASDRYYIDDNGDIRHNISTLNDKPEPNIRKAGEPFPTYYSDLNYFEKAQVDYHARKAGVNDSDIERYYNSGRLLPLLEARLVWPYKKDDNSVYGSFIKKDNTSKTSAKAIGDKSKYNSDLYEVQLNNSWYNRGATPNIDYMIPFDEKSGVANLGNGTKITFNALDSLAKYGAQAKLLPEEYLGLPNRETGFGRIIGFTGKGSESKPLNTIFNSNYFMNYGWIPAEYMINDFAYNNALNNGATVQDRSVPPLLHGFNLYKSGRYNSNETGHSDYVIERGRQALANKDIQRWMSQSKYIKHADGGNINSFLYNPYYRNYINYEYNRFDDGGGTNEVFDVIEPSFIVAERKPMTKRQIRKGSRVVRNILGNLGENGSYTPLQKKRMAEYIIRAQGGLPNPSIPRIIEMRKGLKYKNKDGVSGLERVLYGNEKIKDIIDSINSDHISYDDDGTSVVHGFSMYNYNGSLMDKDERYDNDIVDAYINGVAPYGGKEYVSQYNLGPYKNYIDKYYKGKDIKSYMFGESELPQDTIDRLDRYSYERGDNSFVVGANTDKNAEFRLRGNNDIPDGVYFDAAGHLWQFIKDDDGKFYVRQSDSYDFEPNQYRETYGDAPYIIDALSALESAGNPVLVFKPWKEADDLDLSELTKGKVLVNDVDEDAIKKAIECNKQRKNGKFLNAIDNALTLMYSVTR